MEWLFGPNLAFVSFRPKGYEDAAFEEVSIKARHDPQLRSWFRPEVNGSFEIYFEFNSERPARLTLRKTRRGYQYTGVFHAGRFTGLDGLEVREIALQDFRNALERVGERLDLGPLPKGY